MAQTTIILDKETVNLLKETKEYPRETYNELLKKMIKIFINLFFLIILVKRWLLKKV